MGNDCCLRPALFGEDYRGKHILWPCLYSKLSFSAHQNNVIGRAYLVSRFGTCNCAALWPEVVERAVKKKHNQSSTYFQSCTDNEDPANYLRRLKNSLIAVTLSFLTSLCMGSVLVATSLTFTDAEG